MTIDITSSSAVKPVPMPSRAPILSADPQGRAVFIKHSTTRTAAEKARPALRGRAPIVVNEEWW